VRLFPTREVEQDTREASKDLRRVWSKHEFIMLIFFKDLAFHALISQIHMMIRLLCSWWSGSLGNQFCVNYASSVL